MTFLSGANSTCAASSLTNFSAVAKCAVSALRIIFRSSIKQRLAACYVATRSLTVRFIIGHIATFNAQFSRESERTRDTRVASAAFRPSLTVNEIEHDDTNRFLSGYVT